MWALLPPPQFPSSALQLCQPVSAIRPFSCIHGPTLDMLQNLSFLILLNNKNKAPNIPRDTSSLLPNNLYFSFRLFLFSQSSFYSPRSCSIGQACGKIQARDGRELTPAIPRLLGSQRGSIRLPRVSPAYSHSGRMPVNPE